MSHLTLKITAVTFRYDTMLDPLFEGLTASFPRGWTGIVGPNGSGKTTLLRLASGDLVPIRGSMEGPSRVRYCEQRTDEPPGGLEELLCSPEGRDCSLRGRLGLKPDWSDRWDTLSHGERKRAQIAVALREEPDVLALDEPTNHVDAGVRVLLAEALRSYRGIGLLVSHDRELLDMLCGQCLFLNPPEAVLRKGNYTECSLQREHDRAALVRRRELADEEVRRLEREYTRRRKKADRDNRVHSGRGISPKDHDARAKLNGARLTGKDAVQGKLARQMEGRLRQAGERRDTIPIKREAPGGIRLDYTRSRRDFLFRAEQGEIQLGPGKLLRFPLLAMLPEDRVSLTGPNGAGKSTLLRYIFGILNVPPGRALVIPQEIPPEAAREAVERVRAMPGLARGQLMTLVSRLGSDPERLLRTDMPSPGETRKLLLALGMIREPQIIIMDEPTNHMDLASVECLETALDGCGCGLLLVSHDFNFLRRLTATRWDIVTASHGGDLHETYWK